jgi:gamma-glutamylcyclotransferase (GGCT)/AIG2-like uncharacterized protein YtfP
VCSRLFVYGTLMCEDIMRAVSGVERRSVAAALAGFRRHAVRGEDYPAIVPARGAEVRGQLYDPLPASAWRRLDAFEGAQYSREPVRVTLPGGREVRAWTYVFRAGYVSLLAEGDWHFEAFAAVARERFMARHLGAQPADQ